MFATAGFVHVPDRAGQRNDAPVNRGGHASGVGYGAGSGNHARDVGLEFRGGDGRRGEPGDGRVLDLNGRLNQITARIAAPRPASATQSSHSAKARPTGPAQGGPARSAAQRRADLAPIPSRSVAEGRRTKTARRNSLAGVR